MGLHHLLNHDEDAYDSSHSSNNSDTASTQETSMPLQLEKKVAEEQQATSLKTIKADDDDRTYLCRYRNKKCMQPRALKRNGEFHNLCEFHRTKANRNQRKLESKRRIQKKASEQPPAELTMAYDPLPLLRIAPANVPANVPAIPIPANAHYVPPPPSLYAPPPLPPASLVGVRYPPSIRPPSALPPSTSVVLPPLATIRNHVSSLPPYPPSYDATSS